MQWHSAHAAPGQTFSDVFADLRARIIALELPPGEVLSRQFLQQRYGVSSTPVRDALLRLQEEGLVEVFPQSRTIVSRIDLKQARQAQFLRSAIEQTAVHALAEDPGSELIADLGRIVALQEDRAEQGDLHGFTAADQAFHRRLFEAAGVPDLHALVRRESGHIDRVRKLHLSFGDKVQQILADHRRIVGAIAARDPDAAREAMRDHLSKSIAFGAELRAKHPSFFAAPPPAARPAASSRGAPAGRRRPRAAPSRPDQSQGRTPA